MLDFLKTLKVATEILSEKGFVSFDGFCSNHVFSSKFTKLQTIEALSSPSIYVIHIKSETVFESETCIVIRNPVFDPLLSVEVVVDT